MSHTYGLFAQIAVRGDEEKKKVVELFLDGDGPFDLPLTDTEKSGEDELLYFKDTIQLTEPSDEWADRLRDSVWTLLGRFTRIEVVAEDLDSIPTECHSYDEDDYNEWMDERVTRSMQAAPWIQDLAINPAIGPGAAEEGYVPPIHNLARTGRTSSAHPNFCANELWEQMMKGLDFSGIEERVFTPEQRAEIEAFKKMTPEERRNAKSRMFGLLYGMSPSKLKSDAINRLGLPSETIERTSTATLEELAADHCVPNPNWFEEKKARLKEEIPGVECFESPDDVSYVERIRTCACDETSRFPGVLFPSDIKGDSSKPWVTKCPTCDLFKHDFDAAHFVGRMLDRTVAYASLGPSQRPYPYIDGITREKAIALGTKAKDR